MNIIHDSVNGNVLEYTSAFHVLTLMVILKM